MAMSMLDAISASGSNDSTHTTAPLHSNTPSFSSFYLLYVCLYACGSLFLVPSAISWRRMWRNRLSDITAVRLFALLGMGACFRALAFLFVAVWMFFVYRSHGSVKDAIHLHLSYLQIVILWQALGMVAAFVLGGVFLLIFNTWASMIEQVGSEYIARSGASFRATDSRQPHPASPPRLLFIKMVVLVFLLQMATFLFLQMAPEDTMRRSMYMIATALLAICFLVCMFLLPAYGSRMCALLGKVAEDASHRQRNIRRIAAISTIFCFMRVLSLLLLAASQYGRTREEASKASSRSQAEDHSSFDIPVQDIIDANPIFFFTSSGWSSRTWLLHWVVLLEVIEFPLEWALLMALLWVLPSKTVLPSIRGYQPIGEKWKWRQ